MAKDKQDKQDTNTNRTVYVSAEMQELWDRMEKLETTTRVSVSRQVAICVQACIDTMERDMPQQRTFKLNGCTVMP